MDDRSTSNISAGWVTFRWIEGTTRSGKTQRLIETIAAQAEQWRSQGLPQLPASVPAPLRVPQSAPPLLVLAANGDNRSHLSDRLSQTVADRHPLEVTTPLGFIEREVLLFWPQIAAARGLTTAFPLRLQSETELELAQQRWATEIAVGGALYQTGVASDRQVRRILDLLQLATAAGVDLSELADRLDRGLPPDLACPALAIQQAAIDWWHWTLECGLLTYGTLLGLYRLHLLRSDAYCQQLTQRFSGLYADDVNEYPAMTLGLFEVFAQADRLGTLTFHADWFTAAELGETLDKTLGQPMRAESLSVRRGINADPDALWTLRSRAMGAYPAHYEALTQRVGLAAQLREPVLAAVYQPFDFTPLPAAMQKLSAVSRSQLLRHTAETIADLITSGQVSAREIAVIAPGLDAVSRYAITTILSGRGIPTRTLNVQRPLSDSPRVRALLTLLALVYRRGDRLDRDAIAEMLTLISPQRRSGVDHLPPIATHSTHTTPDIDPVRAGMIADICYVPDREAPDLVSLEIFPRRDRLGYRASTAYGQVHDWLLNIRAAIAAEQLDALATIERILRDWFWRPQLTYDARVELRAAIESSQHYWDVQRQVNPTASETVRVEQFIQLLRSGAIAADPFPLRPVSGEADPTTSVLLSNIFQYRTTRQTHRWQFWLDVGSPLWAQGGAAELFGAPLFLQAWQGKPLDEAFELEANDRRLRGVLVDLIARAEERIILCYSDLDTTGTERLGALLPLVEVASELARPTEPRSTPTTMDTASDVPNVPEPIPSDSEPDSEPDSNPEPEPRSIKSNPQKTDIAGT